MSNQGARATREEHRANMRKAEQAVLESGGTPAVAARALAAEVGVSERQAFRYVKAVRARFASDIEKAPLPTLEETIATLLTRAVQCVQGDDPDWKASVKCTELACRLRGWLDRKSTVTVDGSVQVTHALQHKVDAMSTAERLALAAFQQARDLRAAGLVDAECVPEEALVSASTHNAPAVPSASEEEPPR